MERENQNINPKKRNWDRFRNFIKSLAPPDGWTSALNLVTNNLREVYFSSCLERFRQLSANLTWYTLQLRLLRNGSRQLFKRENTSYLDRYREAFRNLTLATNSDLLINSYVEHDMDRQNRHRNPEKTNWDRIKKLIKSLLN